MQRKLDLISVETSRLNILKEDQLSQRMLLNQHVNEAKEKEKKAEKRDALSFYKERREEEEREEAAQMARTKSLVTAMHESLGDSESLAINASVVHVLGNYQSKFT